MISTSTDTDFFTDGLLSLTPLVHDGTELVQNTFNFNAARLGIDGNGTNNNAFNDPDTELDNLGEEALRFEFDASVGLSQIAYDFARADGPGPRDGVVISGFTGDPQVSFSIDNPTLFSEFNSAEGSVRLNIPGGLFNGTEVFIDFAFPAASAGQTLLLTVNDTTQAGAQFPIRSISYSDDLTGLPTPGDVNGDDLVTIADFAFIRDNFYLEGATRAQGDLTGDGLVAIADFEQWKDNFPGNGAAFASQLFSAVPEPGSALLLAAGFALAAARRRG